MATSSTNSWLNPAIMSPPTSQQQSSQHGSHGLYGTDVQLQSASHVQQQQNMNLGPATEDSRSCGAFCRPDNCPIGLDFHQSADSHQAQDFSRPAGGSCSGGHTSGKGSGDYGGQVSARKMHKADREKLRRERLNEQFAELAGVLDPDRPKNDKATILGDSVQIVKELRSEVKRLRTEQNSLMDESRDLTQEKTELREEKSVLKTETENLQAQLQQRLRLLLPWMSMDPSVMMPPYGYPMPVAQPVSAPPPPASEPNQQPALPQGSVPQPQPAAAAAAPPYIPLPSPPQGAYALHPALQAYTMYSNRPGDGNSPYLPYPHYPSQVSSHPQVERPYPQYASPMQPYLVHMQPHQGQNPLTVGPPVSSMYQSFVPGMPLMPPRTEEPPPNAQARVGGRHPDSAYGHHGPPVMPYPELAGSYMSVQTTLQLQTPVNPQPPQPSQIDEREGSSKTDTGCTASPVSGIQRESQPASQTTKTSGVSGSTLSPSTKSPPAVSSPDTSTTPREAGGAQSEGGGNSGAPQPQDSAESHDPMLRPPAA